MNCDIIKQNSTILSSDDGQAGDKRQIQLLSNEVLKIIQIVNNIVLCGGVCVVGIVVNIINMIIFLKQDLSNNVNISMFAITVSDLCSLITLQWLNINLNPFMENADVPFEPSEIQYLTGGWPHSCFLQITIWITVYVTAERFICIALPLKVKQIFTTFRTKLVISAIYVLMFLALFPEYVTLYFGENFYQSRNETRVGLKDRGLGHNINESIFMLYAVIGIASFITLIMFTCLLVLNLKQRSKWRTMSTHGGRSSESFYKRDRKTMKMVSLMSICLIIFTTPGMFLSVTAFFVSGFELNGEYNNMVHATWSFAFLSEAINSTANIFFFYKMSTKYRNTSRELFALFTRCGKPGHGRETREMEGSSSASTVVSTERVVPTSRVISARAASATPEGFVPPVASAGVE